jgi:hypothetical protein
VILTFEIGSGRQMKRLVPHRPCSPRPRLQPFTCSTTAHADSHSAAAYVPSTSSCASASAAGRAPAGSAHAERR